MRAVDFCANCLGVVLVGMSIEASAQACLGVRSGGLGRRWRGEASSAFQLGLSIASLVLARPPNQAILCDCDNSGVCRVRNALLMQPMSPFPRWLRSWIRGCARHDRAEAWDRCLDADALGRVDEAEFLNAIEARRLGRGAPATSAGFHTRLAHHARTRSKQIATRGSERESRPCGHAQARSSSPSRSSARSSIAREGVSSVGQDRHETIGAPRASAIVGVLRRGPDTHRRRAHPLPPPPLTSGRRVRRSTRPLAPSGITAKKVHRLLPRKLPHRLVKARHYGSPPQHGFPERSKAASGT